MWPRPSWRGLVTAALGILIALVPVASLLWYRRPPDNTDFFRYQVLSEFFSEALAEGIWYPRWIPDMNGGYGYPLFVFYQPGYFYLSHLFSRVDAPTLRSALTLGAVALTGAFGAYRLARGFARPPASLFFVLMFQLTPYHFTEIHGRGDLSEWIALQLSPWPLYFLSRLARDPAGHRGHRGWGIGLAVALACMGYAHPVTHVLFLPVLLAMAGGLGLGLGPRDRWAYVSRVAASVLIGVALSSPYWLTVVGMKHLVNTGAVLSGHFDPSNHLLSPLAFFSSGADGLSRRLRLSFELGAVHFGLALCGVWLGRRESFVVAAWAVYAAMLVLMTRVAAPFWSLYPFYLMQFPWRLLAVCAVFQLICMLGIGRLEGRNRWPVVVAAVAVVGVTIAWHADELAFRPMPADILQSPVARQMIAASFPGGHGFLPIDVATPGRRDIRDAAANARRAAPFTIFSTLDGAEWVPMTALANPLRRSRGESFLEILHGSASWAPEARSTKFRLDYAIDAATPATVLINQLYLPGWRVSVDGRAIPDAALRDGIHLDGRMTLGVGAGKHRVQAWYDGPPHWRWHALFMAALTAVGVAWLFRSGHTAR